MNTLRTFFQTSSWKSLSILITLVSVLVLMAVQSLMQVVDITVLLSLICIGVGAFSVISGYAVAGHSGYEIIPMKRQVFGGLINGVAIAVLIYSGLKVFASTDGFAAPLLLFLSAVLLFVEFLSVRISQNKKVTIQQLLALLFTTAALAYLGNSFSAEVQYFVALFLGAGLVMEVSSRVTTTYLLSPWVSSFWNGWSVLVTGLVVVPVLFSISLTSLLVDLAYLPLWLGCVVAILGLSVMVVRFFKHKFRISRGYMQYKLQLLTLLFGISAVLFVSDAQVLLAFALVSLAYAVAEGRLVIKE